MLHFPHQALPAWVLSGCTLPPAGKVDPNITLNIYLTINTFPLPRPPQSYFVINVFTHLFCYYFSVITVHTTRSLLFFSCSYTVHLTIVHHQWGSSLSFCCVHLWLSVFSQRQNPTEGHGADISRNEWRLQQWELLCHLVPHRKPFRLQVGPLLSLTMSYRPP